MDEVEIGNLVDSSQESASRVITEFERDSIVKITGGKIEILNKKSLIMISSNS